tara:strand:- start:58 stop:309 length:252 start_codon:yes stop_codon:yes gene_type:complete
MSIVDEENMGSWARKQHDMEKFIYTICDDEGYTLLEILSPCTSGGRQRYFDDYVRPLLPAIALSHNRPDAYWDCRGRYNGEEV